MSMPVNKELYIQILHKVLIENLQNDTGGHEEAIKNVCYCMALCHLKREPLANFSIWLYPIFQSTVPPYEM